ncbi:hypothetical protein L596_008858 [Steinernema carpocapsae]|uniref:Uncharacterized protein n=1 Tax=Steinernema carpocapsae TaxID=34508 RepID=A0A4U5PE82_STECR|nr:hypothetical protein L596_008858 [Steinernema carpocapsae]
MLVPKRCFIVAASVSLLIYTVLKYPTVQLILSQTPNHKNLRFALQFLLLLFGSLPKRGIPAPGTQKALRHVASAELLLDASRTQTLQTLPCEERLFQADAEDQSGQEEFLREMPRGSGGRGQEARNQGRRDQDRRPRRQEPPPVHEEDGRDRGAWRGVPEEPVEDLRVVLLD